MPRRTLREARKVLDDDVARRVNDVQLRDLTAVMEEEEQKARATVGEMIVGESEAVNQMRSEALRALTEVRDKADALVAQAQEGRISAEEYAARLDDLAERQQQAESRLEEASTKVNYLERGEEDPIAFYSDLQQRIPTMRADLPW
jgi:hypothetical protein